MNKKHLLVLTGLMSVMILASCHRGKESTTTESMAIPEVSESISSVTSQDETTTVTLSDTGTTTVSEKISSPDTCLTFELQKDDTYYVSMSSDSITEADIPAEYNGHLVTGIKDNAFKNAISLESVRLPDTITYIGYNAFANCIKLENVTLPDSVKKIHGRAFYNSGIKSIRIPASVEDIGSYAFSHCMVLEFMSVDSENIVYDSRDNCNAIILTKNNELIAGCNGTVIPKSIAAISQWSFCGAAIVSVNIPAKVEYISPLAFNDCWALSSITVDSENLVYDSRDDSNAIIKTKSNELIVGCQNTVIPDSITEIGNSAFKGSYIKTICIPDSVISISSSAFENCSQLTYTVYDHAYYLGNESNPYVWLMKAENEDITSCQIHENTKHIAPTAFQFSNLTSVTLPSGILSVGEFAFAQCFSLTEVTLSEELMVMEMDAFYNCDKLSEITIPSKITEIQGKCFYKCSALQSVTLPDNLISIGEYAFADTALSSVEIPDSVTSIGNGAFCRTALKSIAIPSGVTSIESYAFEGCSGLESVFLPEEIEKIGNNAFQNCSSLKSITVPSSVTEIGSYAFSNCLFLTSVTISDTVQIIDSYSFEGCTALTDIIYQGTKTGWNSISFDSSWNKSTGEYKVHCSDGDIIKES